MENYSRLSQIECYCGRQFPHSNITDILDSLGKSKYFLTIDCANGFWQIPVREEDRPKTAFSTEYGHFEYKSIPFGIKGAQQPIHQYD